ncbi:MAG TPA: hypothetical protein VLB72_07985 [Burkholderiales bacterium]|nr:hypothetical protein [Burkholderiales bacterium]
MTNRFLLLGFGCVMALAGCGVVKMVEPMEPAPWVQPGSPQPASDVESLVLYFPYVSKLSAPEAIREHEVAWHAFARANTDFNRVRLAIVLSRPGMAFTDEARAAGLLETVAAHQGRLQGLAVVLGASLKEQQRLAASAQELQQKLDALKSLERSMIERNK